MRALLLAIACFVATGLGVVLAFVPVTGAVFAFGAPALALLGVIVGGLDLSRLRREGKPRDAALVGTVLSALGFFPALITALTCGVCNALVSAGPIELRRGMHFQVGQGALEDAGVPGWPLPSSKPRGAGMPSATPEPSAPSAPSAPNGPAAPATSPPSAVPAAPSALPSPPLPAGPGARP